MGLSGCNTDLWVQPKTKTLEKNDFFMAGQSARPLVEGAVARGHLREDEVFFTGIQNGAWVNDLPMPVTEELLKRGQERYNIYCSPCHGMQGDGEGMITHRGLELVRPPATYHTDRLREMPVGHFYNVITNGYGVMYSYAARVEPQDRWAIVAYIRALQLSQNVRYADLTEEERAEMAAQEHAAAQEKDSHQGGAH